jgi:hypothetical protein
MPALLSLYDERLAELRDTAGVHRFVRRLVHEARKLDDYLIRDGLDAATVTSGLERFTSDVTQFRWDVPGVRRGAEPPAAAATNGSGVSTFALRLDS